MTSKEALTILINSSLGDEKAKRKFKKNYGEIVTKLFNDLQVLEILKEHYDVNFLEVSPNYFVGYSIYEDNKDFKKVKEWLDEEEKEERVEND